MKLKKLVPVFILLVSTSFALAAGDLASKEDKQFLCNKIKNQTEAADSELYIDMHKCLINKTIRLVSAETGQTEVFGEILFYRSGVDKEFSIVMNCKSTYIGKPSASNNSDLFCGY